ncbi:hypothetical protein TNCV_2431341 [Trichonephila clavipes]|nr:hypothetical protein TNCV_2431341 [Trichonephila clavipes]
MIVPSTFYWNRWCFKNECCTASPPKQDWRKFYRVDRNIYLEPCIGRTKIAYVGRQCITMSKVAFHDTAEILRRDKLFSRVLPPTRARATNYLPSKTLSKRPWMEFLVSSTPRGDPQPCIPTHTIFAGPSPGCIMVQPRCLS